MSSSRSSKAVLNLAVRRALIPSKICSVSSFERLNEQRLLVAVSLYHIAEELQADLEGECKLEIQSDAAMQPSLHDSSAVNREVLFAGGFDGVARQLLSPERSRRVVIGLPQESAPQVGSPVASSTAVEHDRRG